MYYDKPDNGQGFFNRANRVRLHLLFFIYFAYEHFNLEFQHKADWLVRLLHLGILLIFGSFAWMDWSDLKWLKKEEAAMAADPKHIFINHVGYSAHPRVRKSVAIGVLCVGIAKILQAFQLGAVGSIFFGVAICLVALILFVFV